MKKKKRDVFKDGSIEIVREGRNIFYKNAMDEIEFQAYQAQLKENRPRLLDDINKMTADLYRLINSFDKIFILGSVAGIVIDAAQKETDEKQVGEIALEYCQSLCTSSANLNVGKGPNASDTDIVYDMLVKIREYASMYYALEHLEGKHTEGEYEVRKTMLLERLFVRGEGYLEHVEELFLEMFSPHDEFFKREIGFTPADIVQTFKQVESSFTLRVASPEGHPHPFFVQTLQRLSKQKDKQKALIDYARDNPGMCFENGKPMLFPINWIPYYDKLYKIRHHNEIQKKVVEALSMPFGGNETFAKYNPNFIINESDIYTKPFIVDDNGGHYLFNMNIGARNYFQIAQHLIKTASPDYYNNSYLGNRLFISKDNFVERKVIDLFKKMLPDVTFHSNLKYRFLDETLKLKCTASSDGNYELDILGISDSATYVIEVKAGLMNEESRRGAVKSLKSNLSKIIGEAICQSYRAHQFITRSDLPVFIDVDKQAIVPTNKDNVYRITICFSYIGDLTSSLLKLKELGTIDKNAEFAWTINIFDLMAISAVIGSEGEFIDFLSKRIPLYEDKRLAKADELDMLGFYFHDNFIVDSVHDNADSVTLNGYREDFDKYFELGGPKPINRHFKKQL